MKSLVKATNCMKDIAQYQDPAQVPLFTFLINNWFLRYLLSLISQWRINMLGTFY